MKVFTYCFLTIIGLIRFPADGWPAPHQELSETDHGEKGEPFQDDDVIVFKANFTPPEKSLNSTAKDEIQDLKIKETTWSENNTQPKENENDTTPERDPVTIGVEKDESKKEEIEQVTRNLGLSSMNWEPALEESNHKEHVLEVNTANNDISIKINEATISENPTEKTGISLESEKFAKKENHGTSEKKQVADNEILNNDNLMKSNQAPISEKSTEKTQISVKPEKFAKEENYGTSDKNKVAGILHNDNQTKSNQASTYEHPIQKKLILLTTEKDKVHKQDNIDHRVSKKHKVTENKLLSAIISDAPNHFVNVVSAMSIGIDKKQRLIHYSKNLGITINGFVNIDGKKHSGISELIEDNVEDTLSRIVHSHRR